MSEALIKPGETRAVSLTDDTDWQEQQEIPEEKANQTFKELGLEVLTLKRIRGYKKVSQILKKIGMVEYERGRLLHREMHLEVARQSLADICNSSGGADTKVAAAMALNAIVQAENKTAELNIRLEELAKANDQGRKLASELPPIGPINLGVATHVHVENAPPKVDVTPHEPAKDNV
jgi:hypothetical protein